MRVLLPFAVLAGCAHARPAPPPAHPNVIVVLIDDLGWRDFGGYGSDLHETPRIDRLATQGAKFTHAYAAAPICSPTRAAILTGKAPARLHLTDWIPGHAPPADAKLTIPDWTKRLSADETTLAEALAPAGYVSASIGKWHLGGPEETPEKQGFALNVGGTNKGQPPSYFAPYGIPNIADPLPGVEYLTDRLTDEALRFIDGHRAQPFFLYLAHYGVHTPIQARVDLTQKYARKVQVGAQHTDPKYAAMIESVDQSVGRIVDHLAALDLARSTVVIVTSDNGGLMRITSNAPLRNGKGTAYEGGVRVPLIVSWPGVVPAQVVETPVVSMDLFPTVLEFAGTPARQSDGESLVSLLTGKGPLAARALYWHYPHYHGAGGKPFGAIRSGDLRLVEHFEDGRLELFNLRDDVGEQKDLAAALPAKAAELRDRLARWRKAVGAQMPGRR